MAKRRGSGEGGLFQRADGMWVGSVEVAGPEGKRAQKRVYAKTRAACRDKLKALQDDIEQGHVPVSSKVTVGKWMRHWLDTIHGPTVRPNTRDFYDEAIRLHITPHIGTRPLGKLTADDVRGMLRDIESSRNRQRAHQTLNLGLKAAVVDKLLKYNVCEAVAKPGHTAEVRQAFSAADAKRIIRAGLNTAHPTRWAAAFLTGARQAELLGLEWSRVNLDEGWVDLAWQLQQLKKAHGCGGTCGRDRPSYCPQARWDFADGFEYRECYRSLVFTRPKTAAGTRVIPLLPAMVEMLKLEQDRGPNPHNLVWHHDDGRPIAPKTDRAAWQQLLIDAGVTTPGKPIALHSARHSTATLLQDAGVPQETRMRLMGQSSEAAHRGYIHVDQSQVRAALTNLSGLLDA